MSEKRTDKYGEWALITGASSGIGLAFCKNLAAQGYNLILVARTQSKLESSADQLSKTFGIYTSVVTCDLSRPDEVSNLKEIFLEKNVGLLVNNAGWGQPGVFHKHSLENSIRETQLNINTPLSLTKWFLNESKSEKKGVIFLSSIAAYMGSPYLGNYSATKAWVLNFGLSLYHELKDRSVDVLVLAPGPTKTGMFGIESVDFSKMPMHWMTADKVAKSALNKIGKQPVHIPGTMNKIMSFVMGKILPRSSAQKLFGMMMKPAMPKSIL